MAGIEARSFGSPDETRTPEKSNISIVKLGSTTAGRFEFQPGWRWSECIKPVAGTDTCQARHIGVVVSGRLHIEHEDGTVAEATAGHAYVVEPGHDAWVVGDEPWVAYEFESKSVEDYAKGS